MKGSEIKGMKKNASRIVNQINVKQCKGITALSAFAYTMSINNRKGLPLFTPAHTSFVHFKVTNALIQITVHDKVIRHGSNMTITSNKTHLHHTVSIYIQIIIPPSKK